MPIDDRTRVIQAPHAGGLRSSEVVLSVLAGPDTGRLVSARGPGAALRLGRGPDNDLVLHDEGVSRQHAIVEAAGGKLILRDLESTNGTIVNGVQVRSCELHSGEVIRCGRSAVRVSFREETLHLPPGSEDRLDEIWGRSPAMRKLYTLVRRIAPSPLPVLVLGETGTGKELVARALHRLSPRASQPFVALNCAALPRELIESELFGHERGAFTGATGQRKGAFELASGGTLLLDEIGELSLDLQPRLLRAVETGAFRRVGGSEEVRVTVRVVAATNRDLAHEVEAGRFRQDLYYRLYGLSLVLPPLRERADDILFLADIFLAGLGGGATLSPPAVRRLTAYHWPGNVRELRFAVERAVTLSTTPELGEEAFDTLKAPTTTAPPGSPLDLETSERVAIERALREHPGNKRAAAAALGIAYSTLYEKLRKYGLRD